MTWELEITQERPGLEPDEQGAPVIVELSRAGPRGGLGDRVPPATSYPDGAMLEKRNGLWLGPEAPHVVTRTMARALVTPPGTRAIYPVFDYPERTFDVITSAYGQKTSSGHEWEHGDSEDGNDVQALEYLPDGALSARSAGGGTSTALPGNAFSLIKDFSVLPGGGNDSKRFPVVGVSWLPISNSSQWNSLRCVVLSWLDNRNVLAAAVTSATAYIISLVDGQATTLASDGLGQVRGGTLLHTKAQLHRVKNTVSDISWGVSVRVGVWGRGKDLFVGLRTEDQQFVQNAGKVGLGAQATSCPIYAFYAGMAPAVSTS